MKINKMFLDKVSKIICKKELVVRLNKKIISFKVFKIKLEILFKFLILKMILLI